MSRLGLPQAGLVEFAGLVLPTGLKYSRKRRFVATQSMRTFKRQP